MGLLDKFELRPQNDDESDSQSGLQFDSDPAPGERPATKRRSRRPAAATPRKATASATKIAKEVAEDLASLIEGTAVVWGLQDECCAPILEAQAKPIAVALTAILARNPRLLAKFADTDIVAYTLQTAALGRALLPVGQAVYRNHVSQAYEDGESVHGPGAVNLAGFPAFSS